MIFVVILIVIMIVILAVSVLILRYPCSAVAVQIMNSYLCDPRGALVH
jgi:hypothetical protein